MDGDVGCALEEKIEMLEYKFKINALVDLKVALVELFSTRKLALF